MRLEAKVGVRFKVGPFIVGAVIFLQSFYCFIGVPSASALAGITQTIKTTPLLAEGKGNTQASEGGAQVLELAPTPDDTSEVDMLPPTVPTSGAPHNMVMTTHDFSLTWQASTDIGDDEVTYELRARAGTQPDDDTPVLGSLMTPSTPFKSVSGFGDGEWYWQVRAIDAAQNKSDWSESWHMAVDASGPGIAISLPSAGGVFGGPDSRQIPFSATITDPSGVSSYTVELDSNNVTSQAMADGALGAQALTLTAVFESTTLVDGDHVVRVSATDGNGVTNEASLLFTVDATNPVITTNIKQNQVLQDIISVKGEAADPRLLSFTINIFDSEGESLVLDAQNDSGEIASSEMTAMTARVFEWDTSRVADGSYKIQMTARDSVGNETVLTRTVSVNNVPDVIGGGPITDPLLDQLSKQLTQPFPLTANLTPPSFIAQNTMQKASDTSANSVKVSVPETDRNAETVAIAPSEEGWRIYGVAWYWWLLLALATSFILYRWRLVYKETRAPRFEEA